MYRGVQRVCNYVVLHEVHTIRLHNLTSPRPAPPPRNPLDLSPIVSNKYNILPQRSRAYRRERRRHADTPRQTPLTCALATSNNNNNNVCCFSRSTLRDEDTVFFFFISFSRLVCDRNHITPGAGIARVREKQ